MLSVYKLKGVILIMWFLAIPVLLTPAIISQKKFPFKTEQGSEQKGGEKEADNKEEDTKEKEGAEELFSINGSQMGLSFCQYELNLLRSRYFLRLPAVDSNIHLPPPKA